MVLLQKQLKSLHLMYFDLFTIMILIFSNSQVWASIVDPDQPQSGIPGLLNRLEYLRRTGDFSGITLPGDYCEIY